MYPAARLLSRLPALVGSLALLATACTEGPAPLAPDAAVTTPVFARGVTPASAAAPSPAQANYEIKFMQDMIDHHMMAIMMAQLCLEKTVHTELRALCTEITAAQRAEIEQMQAWLQAWYGISYEPQMTPGAMQHMEKMAALSPAEFEVAFMEMMIKHHTKAVKEGEQCLDKSYHADLEQLCQDIIAAQTREIALMESWLCAWYGICK